MINCPLETKIILPNNEVEVAGTGEDIVGTASKMLQNSKNYIVDIIVDPLKQ